MSPEAIYEEAHRRGMFLTYWSDTKVCVEPVEKLDAAFEQTLLAHRHVLIPWLKKNAGGWLHLCAQILAGEFDGVKGQTLRNLENALRGDEHPIRQRAFEHLRQHNESET